MLYMYGNMVKIKTTKKQVIEGLKMNIEDCKDIMANSDAWDINDKENWQLLIENMNMAIEYIKKYGK